MYWYRTVKRERERERPLNARPFFFLEKHTKKKGHNTFEGACFLFFNLDFLLTLLSVFSVFSVLGLLCGVRARRWGLPFDFSAGNWSDCGVCVCVVEPTSTHAAQVSIDKADPPTPPPFV